MMKSKIILNLAALVFLTAGTSLAEVGVGEMAPQFSATDTHGETHNLSDYAGEYVVLEWMNPDCPFVRKHYDSGNMQMLQEKYTDQEVVWLTINSSAEGQQGYYPAEELNSKIAESKALPTAVIQDTSGEIGRMYGAKTTPHIFIIDPEGKLIYQGAIDDMPSTEMSDIEKSQNYIDQVLGAALTGETVKNFSTKSYGCSVKYKS